MRISHVKIRFLALLLAMFCEFAFPSDSPSTDDLHAQYVGLIKEFELFCSPPFSFKSLYPEYVGKEEMLLYEKYLEESVNSGKEPVFDTPSFNKMMADAEMHPMWQMISRLVPYHRAFLGLHRYPQYSESCLVPMYTAAFIDTFIFPKMFQMAKERKWSEFEEYFQTVLLAVSPNSANYHMLAKKLNAFLPRIVKHCAMPDATKNNIKSACDDVSRDFVDIMKLDISRLGCRFSEEGRKSRAKTIDEFKHLIATL